MLVYSILRIKLRWQRVAKSKFLPLLNRRFFGVKMAAIYWAIEQWHECDARPLYRPYILQWRRLVACSLHLDWCTAAVHVTGYSWSQVTPPIPHYAALAGRYICMRHRWFLLIVDLFWRRPVKKRGISYGPRRHPSGIRQSGGSSSSKPFVIDRVASFVE